MTNPFKQITDQPQIQIPPRPIIQWRLQGLPVETDNEYNYERHHGTSGADSIYITIITSPNPSIMPYASVRLYTWQPNWGVEFICDLTTWKLSIASTEPNDKFIAKEINKRYSDTDIIRVVKDALSRWMDTINPEPLTWK